MKHPRLAAWIVVAAVAAMTPPRASHALDARDRPTRRPAPTQPAQRETVCTVRLVVRQTQGAAGCFIDERVTGAPGVLRYPCGGGPATAAFRNGTFAGRVDASGVVSLALQTHFHFSDGCDWQSAQSITGTITGALSFQYGESPVAGQQRCAPSCHAEGSVEVQR